jgi:hypothetical protein
MVGVTTRLYGLLNAVTVLMVTPSLYEICHGAKPVSTTFKVAELPLHTVAVPLNTLVGLGLTVTTALPVISPGKLEHETSVKLVTVYVVVVIGETIKV